MRKIKVKNNNKVIVSVGISAQMDKALTKIRKNNYKNRHQQILGIIVDYLKGNDCTKLGIEEE